jgi:dihydrofolate reductase
MKILIAAVSDNNALGKNNQLLWHLPNDFKRFKTLTTGHYIIMGRKTFESFPKPLPNRIHVVITRNNNYSYPDCLVVHSLEQAFQVVPSNEISYIIGGGEIYKQAIDSADVVELTRVHGVFEADTFFPVLDKNQWELIFSEKHEIDARHAYAFTFETYKKNR